MSEWKETSIGSLCTIKHGFAYKGEYITNEKCSNVLVTPGNFTLSGGFKMMDKPKYYKGPVEKEYILKEGDLIVTMTDLSKGIDTLGYSALVPKINGITFHHNQRIGLIENISVFAISLIESMIVSLCAPFTEKILSIVSHTLTR